MVRERAVRERTGRLGPALAGLVGFLLGIVVTLLVQFAMLPNRLDPGSPACRDAFEAFSEGERTPDLRELVRSCTRDR